MTISINDFEIWKDISEYEGLYQVSDQGRVRSLNYNRSGKPKLLKPGKNKQGYLIVILRKNKQSKTFYVHRLVAEAFLPNTENYPTVDHISTIKTDCRVSNLRFCTQKSNICDNEITIEKFRNKDHNKISHYKYNVSSKSIIVKNLESGETMFFYSLSDAGRYLRVRPDVITEVLKGRQKSFGGGNWGNKKNKGYIVYFP